MTPRQYQVDAIDAAEAAWSAGARAVLLVAATGIGKTVIFAHAARKVVEAGGRVLVLAHRDELIQQAADKIRAIVGIAAGIEKAEQRVDEDGFAPSRVVCSSVQSLRGARLNRFRPDAFDLIVVDESHRAVAPTYRAILDHFSGRNVRVLGVTATPDRLDEAALGKVFDAAPYTYGIREAIGDGWLVPIRQQAIRVESLDLSRLRTVAGDFAAGELQAILDDERVSHEIVAPTIEIAAGRSTLVFAGGVEHSKRMAQIFNRHAEGSAVHLDGTTPADERSRAIRDFRAGEYQFLCNYGIATEGFDAPIASVVAMGRPTKSRALYTQMAGRGGRPLDAIARELAHCHDADERRALIADSAKPRMEILDFVGNSGRHQLVTALDILGNDLPDDVVERTRARMGSCAVDVFAELELTLDMDRQAEAEKRRRILAGAQWGAMVVDPFALLDFEPRRESGIVAGKMATDAQRRAIRAGGLLPDPRLSYFEAERQLRALARDVERRRNRGLCSFKQAKTLAKFGLPAEVSFAEAKRTLDIIAANGWQLPPALAQEAHA